MTTAAIEGWHPMSSLVRFKGEPGTLMNVIIMTLTGRTLMPPFYEELCQGVRVREAFECAPSLVGVSVVRPRAARCGRSTLTPPARRRGMAPAPGPAGFLAGTGGGSVEGAGPGSSLPEEPMPGVRSAALDFRAVPQSPPGSAFSVTGARVAASATSWRQTTPDRRRQRMASIEVFPPASLRR